VAERRRKNRKRDCDERGSDRESQNRLGAHNFRRELSSTRGARKQVVDLAVPSHAHFLDERSDRAGSTQSRVVHLQF
jgi:hypothetical protein